MVISAFETMELTSSQESGSPKRLLLIEEFFDSYPADKKRIMREWIADFEATFQLKAENIDMEREWSKFHSSSPQDQSPQGTLHTFLYETMANIVLKDFNRNYQPFRTGYLGLYGHYPYINPMVRYKLDLGSNLSAHDYDVAVARKNTFDAFFRSTIVRDGHYLLVPNGEPQAKWRDMNDG